MWIHSNENILILAIIILTFSFFLPKSSRNMLWKGDSQEEQPDWEKMFAHNTSDKGLLFQSL